MFLYNIIDRFVIIITTIVKENVLDNVRKSIMGYVMDNGRDIGTFKNIDNVMFNVIDQYMIKFIDNFMIKFIHIVINSVIEKTMVSSTINVIDNLIEKIMINNFDNGIYSVSTQKKIL